MVSFAYSCGALGGVLVEDPDEENTPFALSELPLWTCTKCPTPRRVIWQRHDLLRL